MGTEVATDPTGFSPKLSPAGAWMRFLGYLRVLLRERETLRSRPRCAENQDHLDRNQADDAARPFAYRHFPFKILVAASRCADGCCRLSPGGCGEGMSGSVSRRLHTGRCCQVRAEEAGNGRGAIVVGDALMQLPRHCRVSPPAPTHANTPTTNTTTTITQPGARTPALPSASRGFWRVHAHQATEEQQKDLVGLYLSSQSHVVFFISIHLARM